jgi:hypothetical protein
MKNKFQNLKNWCNANSGLLTIVTFLIVIIPFNKINADNLNSTFKSVFTFLNFRLEIPLYIVILLLIIGLIYFQRLRDKYKRKTLNLSNMAGMWKNEWAIIGGSTGTEMFQLTKDGKYLVNGEHWFTLKEFEYNENLRQIKFIKSSVRPNDSRKLVNIVKLVNNDLLIGTENNYEIKYTRISV